MGREENPGSVWLTNHKHGVHWPLFVHQSTNQWENDIYDTSSSFLLGFRLVNLNKLVVVTWQLGSWLGILDEFTMLPGDFWVDRFI